MVGPRSRATRLLMPLLAAALGAPPVTATARGRFAIEVFGGGAVDRSSSLEIEQRGSPRLERRVGWQTRSLEQPLYWGLRGSLARPGGAWEVQLLHHKVFATDLPNEVQHFEVSHGFDLLTVARAFELGRGWSARAGAGVVLAHAESIVRGERSSGHGNLGGYELTGPVVLAGLGWRQPLWRHLFLAAEVQGSAAWARVPIARGTASFRNVAGHGLLGLGVRFGRARP